MFVYQNKIVTFLLLLTFVYSTDPIRAIWFTISGTKAPFSKTGIDQVVMGPEIVNSSKNDHLFYYYYFENYQCPIKSAITIYFSVWD